jgi:hypothetical protein
MMPNILSWWGCGIVADRILAAAAETIDARGDKLKV